MEKVKALFEIYKGVDNEALFANLKYFLEAIMPVCDKYDINMAIHPDDPAWSVFGLPRIITSGENLHRMGVDETWLLRQLRQQGYHSAREVFLAVADANKQVAVYPVST